MRLQCAHCKYIWNYRGSHNFWATCPQCRYKVRIIQKPMEILDEIIQTPTIEDEVEDRRVVNIVDDLLKKYNYSKNSLIQILLDIQHGYGWFPKEMLSEVSRQLEVPHSQVHQIAMRARHEQSA